MFTFKVFKLEAHRPHYLEALLVVLEMRCPGVVVLFKLLSATRWHTAIHIGFFESRTVIHSRNYSAQIYKDGNNIT